MSSGLPTVVAIFSPRARTFLCLDRRATEYSFDGWLVMKLDGIYQEPERVDVGYIERAERTPPWVERIAFADLKSLPEEHPVKSRSFVSTRDGRRYRAVLVH
jgi:hypothetical protein